VLTYDKRGVGESGGGYAGPEVGTNNVDAAATARTAQLVARHGPMDLVGWVISLAATKNSAVDSIVLFSGLMVTAREQLRFQLRMETVVFGIRILRQKHASTCATTPTGTSLLTPMRAPSSPRLRFRSFGCLGTRIFRRPCAYRWSTSMRSKARASPMSTSYFQPWAIIRPSQHRTNPSRRPFAG
jgi:hypothetical protein